MFRQKKVERILEAIRRDDDSGKEQEKATIEKKDYLAMMLAAVLLIFPAAFGCVLFLAMLLLFLL